MFLLGLLLPICFISGYTGVTIPTQWVLLSCVLPFSLWKGAKLTSFHWLGIAFVVYAFASLLWSANQYGAVFGIWRVIIWALAFWYGTTAASLSPLWKGLAIGLSLSTLVAITQALGYNPILVGEGQTAGLLFNNTVAGAAIALVLIALACDSLWHYMPILIAGLALSQSRGGVLILTLALVSKYLHWLFALALLAIGAAYFSLHETPTDHWRLQIWGYAIRGLTFFGWGPDAFNDVYFILESRDLHPSFNHPEFVHNDILQLWFSFGIAALVPYTALVYGVTRSTHRYWPVAIGFAALTLFYFPLYTPVPAFIGCVLAGHLCRSYDPLRALSKLRGPAFLQCIPVCGSDQIIDSRGRVSMERLHPQSEA
jgi:hypothetical protein